MVGVVVGFYVLNWVDSSSEMVWLFFDFGVVYLLFIMGLEIDFEEFNWVKCCLFIYGLLILLIGVGMGVLIGLMVGFVLVLCLLFGVLMVIYIFLGYLIVCSYGV